MSKVQQKLPKMISRRELSAGFTLIEVLVALAIVTVSFVALYAAILQMVTATTLMQEKTLASWVAFDRITELRVGGEFPAAGSNSDEIEMGGINWFYTVEIRATESENLRQIIVQVARDDDRDNPLGLASGALPKIVRGPVETDPGGTTQ
jgi:general secretion pathway protein I